MKPTIEEKCLVIFFGFVGLLVGYLLSLILDGWKLGLALIIIIIISYIILIKIPKVYRKNKE